ncbi:hypothetical protein AGIG_G19524 [Arapaima gigas]
MGARLPAPRMCWWRVVLLLSFLQDYLSSMLDCPPTCSCSPTEIHCNKSDDGKLFPLLALQDPGSGGSGGGGGNSSGGSSSIQDLFKNITTIPFRANWGDRIFVLCMNLILINAMLSP